MLQLLDMLEIMTCLKLTCNITVNCFLMASHLTLGEKVRKLIGWVLQTLKTRSSQTMLAIWKSLILCHIDYCSQLWSPYKVGDIQMIEVFIKKKTKNTIFKSLVHYKE